jgi:hypothetical protein
MKRLLTLLPLLTLGAFGCASSNSSSTLTSATGSNLAPANSPATALRTSTLQTASGNGLRPALTAYSAFGHANAASTALQAHAAANAARTLGYQVGIGSQRPLGPGATLLARSNPHNVLWTNEKEKYVYVAAGPGMYTAVPAYTPRAPFTPYHHPMDLSFLIPKTPDAQKVGGWFTDQNGDMNLNGQAGPHLIDKKDGAPLITVPGSSTPDQTATVDPSSPPAASANP